MHRIRRPKALVTALATVALGAAIAITGPGAAAVESASPSFDLSPTSGTVGTIVHVGSSTECTGQGQFVRVYSDLIAPTSNPIVADVVDGEWEVGFAVPVNTPADTYSISAECHQTPQMNTLRAGEPDTFLYDFEEEHFQVAPRTALVVDPTSGAPGSTFTVTGQDCVLAEGSGGARVTATPSVEGTQHVFPNDTSEWTVTFTVPAGTADGTVVAIDADCGDLHERRTIRASVGQSPPFDFDPVFDYDPAIYTVAVPATPTTPTTPTSPTPTPAAPATPVTVSPNVTG